MTAVQDPTSTPPARLVGSRAKQAGMPRPLRMRTMFAVRSAARSGALAPFVIAGRGRPPALVTAEQAVDAAMSSPTGLWIIPTG